MEVISDKTIKLIQKKRQKTHQEIFESNKQKSKVCASGYFLRRKFENIQNRIIKFEDEFQMMINLLLNSTSKLPVYNLCSSIKSKYKAERNLAGKCLYDSTS
jgi:hypothetical protein